MSEPGNQRVPNLLHLLLFLALTLTMFAVAEGAGLAVAHQPIKAALLNQKLQMLINALAYVLALALALPLFAAVWSRPALVGLHWNRSGAKPLLIVLGLCLGLLSQGASNYLPTPHKMPLEDVFRTPGVIWILVVFGTVLAPLFEEVLFRGFLLPGLAIAVDWLRLPRGEVTHALEARSAWRESNSYSTAALVVSSLVTSFLFALIHAPQLGLNWAPVALLMAVSLVLCWVRLRYDSVAASALVHGCYNFSVFLTLFLVTGGFRHMDRM